MKRTPIKRYKLRMVILSVTLISSLFYSCINQSDVKFNQSRTVLLNSCDWKFAGHLGHYIDTISKSRILNQDNWNTIYPETENAFRLRIDDAPFTGIGLWRGEFWGKYILSAIAAERYYHSEDLKIRISQAVKGLLSTQDSTGYIGTYKNSAFLEGNNWNIWCRKYTLWGLLEAWKLLGDSTILNSAEKFTDNLISEVGPGAIDIIKTGNFYGMPSSSILFPVILLYNATGKTKYLEYAEYIVEQWTKHPEGLPDILNKGLSEAPVHEWFPDAYSWAKGYELTSCVEGLVELYKATGKNRYFETAKKIHEALVIWERSPVGSLGFNDKFVGAAGLINTVSEICDAVYWNRLSYSLFQITGDEKYIEEIERTLYNSLLCSFKTDGTWGLRRLRMSHIHVPAHNHFLQHHQCCTDNLPRGLFQSAEAALSTKNGNVYLSLFNEGEGDVVLSSGSKAHISLCEDFLSTSMVKTIIKMDKPERFNLIIRMPKWSSKTEIKINNHIHKVTLAENWITINRRWEDGDEIEISFKLGARLELFDTGKIRTTNYTLDFFNKTWASFTFIKGSNDSLNRMYKNLLPLRPEDALPQKNAFTLFYGPLALARDIRITGPDLFSTIDEPSDANNIIIKPIKAPQGIWKAYEVNFSNGQSTNFCDFSSAGNTWSDASLFNTWCITED